MSLRVLAWVPHPPAGASGRYRALQLRPLLAAHGVDLDIRPFFDERAFERLYRPGGVVAKAWDVTRGLSRRFGDVGRAREYNLVFVHREICPVAGLGLHRRLARRGVRWVFDLDDAVFIPNVSDANRRFSWLKPFAELAEVAAGAKAVSAGNAWLADWARRQRPGLPADTVEVIPTAVNTDVWRPRERAGGPPRLVWIGTPSTAPYLEPFRGALERLGRRSPGLELHMIGGRIAVENLRVVEHPWSEATEAEIAAQCDVGLAPLPDNDWSRGKCGLKLLLYMSLGIPAVASPVGVHPEMIEHGTNGLLAAGPEAFEADIERLLGDGALRARMGAAARRTVEARYSLPVVAPRLADLLHRAAA